MCCGVEDRDVLPAEPLPLEPSLSFGVDGEAEASFLGVDGEVEVPFPFVVDEVVGAFPIPLFVVDEEEEASRIPGPAEEEEASQIPGAVVAEVLVEDPPFVVAVVVVVAVAVEAVDHAY